ncbi:site-specific integrase [Rhodanobacter sp. 115]|uniref:tyrosine-type recombinase/integrase n=1 Tax=Rhodanobacter sp. FW021-MT20 TaxID=1162282 RepID=UPI001ED8E75F|nr:site-specific integrase [Rhodanobacter sp. 115]
MDESCATSRAGAESPRQVPAFAELNVYVRSTYLEADDQGELRARNVKPIPDGLHILVSGTTGQVVEPVLLFLADKLIRRLLLSRPNRLKKSPHTRKALAYDLKDFYDFLDGNGLTLDAVDDRTLNTYVSNMESRPSPVTGRPYRDNTIIRRLSTVKMFCSWAQDRGLLRHRFLVEEVKSKRPVDSRFLAHLASPRKTEKFAAEVDIPSAPDPSENVTAARQREEARDILDALGPSVPMECFGETEELTDGQSVRDRVMAQCGLYVGLRREEVCDLELTMLNAIRIADDAHPQSNQQMSVHGKGDKWRTVNVPTWLILSMRYYVATERAAVAAKVRAQEANYVPPNRVFLNRSSARTGRGAQVAPKTLGRIFREAQLRRNAACGSGLLTEPGARFHGFHVLRHSYAVYTYISRKRGGDTDPIKYIQAQLGHAHYSTTTDTYLRFAVLAESRLCDVYSDANRMAAEMFGADVDG